MNRVELYGNSVISPGRIGFFQRESGSFQCITRDVDFLRWTVAEDSLSFLAADLTGVKEGSLATAYLVERDVVNGNIGNRTSILVVTPDPSFTGFINITCESSIVNNFCTLHAEVIGEYFHLLYEDEFTLT